MPKYTTVKEFNKMVVYLKGLLVKFNLCLNPEQKQILGLRCKEYAERLLKAQAMLPPGTTYKKAA